MFQIQEDALPQGICPFCLCLLKNVNNFIEKCKEADKILRLALEKNDIIEKIDLDDSTEEEIIFVYDDSNDDDIYAGTTELLYEKEIKKEEIEINNKSDEIPKCGHCGETFDHQKKLMAHYIQNGICRRSRFKCDMCPKTFPKRYKLQQHMRSHTKETPYQCKLCFKTYRCSQNLRRHQKFSHEGVKRFYCRTCHKGDIFLLSYNSTGKKFGFCFSF